MAGTIATFRGARHVFVTEADAYAWLLDQFLRAKGDFFGSIDMPIKDLFIGARRAVYFAQSRIRMRQAKRLCNGWWAETGLSQEQKIDRLYLIAQRIGISSERDYEWRVEGSDRPHPVDVQTLLNRLKGSAQARRDTFQRRKR